MFCFISIVAKAEIDVKVVFFYNSYFQILFLF